MEGSFVVSARHEGNPRPTVRPRFLPAAVSALKCDSWARAAPPDVVAAVPRKRFSLTPSRV